MDCVFHRQGEKWVCRVCRRSVKARSATPPNRNCIAADQPSRGLGDTIAKLTTAIGIKPCGGCKKRQAALNAMFPYKDES